MKASIFAFLLMILGSFIAGIHAQSPGQKLYRIHVTDFSKIKNIEQQGINVYNVKPGTYIDVLATPAQIARLKIKKADIEFIANSFKELMQNRPGYKTGPEYHDYQATIDELIEIADNHPDITRLDTIGHSVLGRAICSLKISDNPDEDEDEPPILIIGCHHGNEILSVEATLYQINYLVENYGTNPEVTNWIDHMEIWYVPLLNPDGREAMRRTNENGIDLNRNYGFEFTAVGNHGPVPFSEPETQAIRDLVSQYPPILSLTYHTSGRYVLYSWTHTDEAAPDSAAMIYLGNLIGESLTFPAGGTTGHYTLRQGGRWYFTAGEYCDYMYATYNTLAFTIEMWTSQSPDASVIPEVVERNLYGLMTLLRQVNRAGVTGIITDADTGLPVQATISVPSINNQGKVQPLQSDLQYGRFYRYFEPGNYTLLIHQAGYRTQTFDLTVSPDSLTRLDVALQPAPLLQLEQVVVLDQTSGHVTGNGDGFINLNETPGIQITLSNQNNITAHKTWVRVSSTNPLLHLQSDSLFLGTIEPLTQSTSADTLLFTVDPASPDGMPVIFNLQINDSVGPVTTAHDTTEVHAPVIAIAGLVIQDTEGNRNGALDNGETATINLLVKNNGRQDVHDLSVTVSTEDPYFQTASENSSLPQLQIGETKTISFEVTLAASTPAAYVANFLATFTTTESYSAVLSFRLNNVHGFYDDFEGGINGWSHATYGTTSNHHDDWQLGSPTGKGGDPQGAFSGSNCWGNDMGWDSYQGTSWNGLYQDNVYSYLRSPVIDCSALSDVGLKYMRWLKTRINDYGRIKVNGQVVWTSARRGHDDANWKEHIIDISAIADHNPSVTITFELETNASGQLGGWNIDDVMVAGELAGSAGLNPSPVVTSANLTNIYPNPFTESTTISYSLIQSEYTTITIYDHFGRKVTTLIAATQLPGTYRITWDGKNNSSQPVAPGIYFCRMQNKSYTGVQSLILIK
ncbi:MAG: DUF2817 domain-containing protein [Bacteroidales bacterium]|nr:DUF2817 domain-containing protein [Bacteroidales bacterium]